MPLADVPIEELSREDVPNKALALIGHIILSIRSQITSSEDVITCWKTWAHTQRWDILNVTPLLLVVWDASPSRATKISSRGGTSPYLFVTHAVPLLVLHLRLGLELRLRARLRPVLPLRVPLRVPLRLRLRLGYASRRCTFRGTTSQGCAW